MKFFLIILLLSYVIYRVSAVLAKVIAAGRDLSGEPQQRKSPQGSNVHVDYVPKGKKGKQGEDYKGGEYVDYEEV